MPKSHFSIEQSCSLNRLSAQARVHVIGVAGVAMAQLAVALSEKNYLVSGSDKDFYEPMGSFLRGSKVKLSQGYAASNIPENVELVVIGNAVSYENPEVQEVERRGLAYTLFPKVLYELVLAQTRPIVVSGTHGKTTTSALAAFVLSQLGLSPGYFVGGACPDLPKSLVLGTGKFSVVEGDEYDSAFFAKLPKFHFYKPSILIVTSLEFDHADIYQNVEAIEQEFDKLVAAMHEATIVVCIDTDRLKKCAERWSKTKNIVITYGKVAQANYRLLKRGQENANQIITAATPQGTAVFKLSIPGEHNALNALALIAAFSAISLDPEQVYSALSKFKGVKRRQEIRVDTKEVTLVEDFAHHPTAVRETIAAIHERFPGRRIVAVYEPRSTASQRAVFQQDYEKCFDAAGLVILAEVKQRGHEAAQVPLNVSAIAETIVNKGIPAVALKDVDQIYKFLLEHRQSGDVVLVMSNGSFGGLIDRLTSSLGDPHQKPLGAVDS